MPPVTMAPITRRVVERIRIFLMHILHFKLMGILAELLVLLKCFCKASQAKYNYYPHYLMYGKMEV